MTNKDILTLVFRILGFYLGVRVLEILQTIGITLGNLGQIPEAQRFGYLFSILLPFLLLLIGAIVLIKWPDQFSARIYKKEEIKDTLKESHNISKEILQQVIYSGIGVLMITNALPHITQTIISFTIQTQWGKTAALNALISVIGLAVQLILGLFLFLNSKTLVIFLKKYNKS